MEKVLSHTEFGKEVQTNQELKKKYGGYHKYSEYLLDSTTLENRYEVEQLFVKYNTDVDEDNMDEEDVKDMLESGKSFFHNFGKKVQRLEDEEEKTIEPRSE